MLNVISICLKRTSGAERPLVLASLVSVLSSSSSCPRVFRASWSGWCSSSLSSCPSSPHLVLVSSGRHGPVDARPRSPHVRPLLVLSSSSCLQGVMVRLMLVLALLMSVLSSSPRPRVFRASWSGWCSSSLSSCPSSPRPRVFRASWSGWCSSSLSSCPSSHLLVLVSSGRHGLVDACPRSPHVRPLLISSSSSSGRHGPVDARPRPRDVHPVRHRDLLDAQQLHEEPRRVSYGEEDAPVRE